MNEFTIIYEGHQVSNNDMKSLHWRELKRLVDPLKLIAKKIIQDAKPPKMERFTVEVRYNSGLDVDNTTATIKILVDQLVKMKVLPKDNKRYWRGMNIIPDETLKHNSLHLKVTECTFPLL